MDKKAKDRSEGQEADEMGMPDATSAIKEWEEVKEAVDATVSETSLPDIEPQGNLTSLVLANII